MSTKKPPITRVRIAREELEKMSNDDFLKCWNLQEQYIDHLEKTLNSNAEHNELVNLRESEEKLRQQQLDATRRENILVMRLTTKEQEMQEFAGQIQELKQAQVPSIAQLRSALLDPAVNLLFEKMRNEMDSLKARLKETQDELNAWKFTPDSNTGKRLMAKCRLLYQENEELGKIISSGRMAKLEGDLALQKSFSEEMKKSQSELDEFLLELDEDVEGMQSTIYYLQQQLRESKDQITNLLKEKQKLTGMANGSSSNHRLTVPDEAMETESQSSHQPSSYVQNNLKPDSNEQQCTDAVNGKEPVKSVLLNLKTEKPASPKTSKSAEQKVSETPKKVHETSVILSASDIKQEICKTTNNLPESNVQSVIVENKNVVAAPEKQAPLLERTNILVDGKEATTEVALRTADPAAEEERVPEEARQNSTNSKRTPEGGGGRGRKRTRARAALEPEEEKEATLPVRKRTRRTREAINAEKKQASLEIDTDTEVQVAQTLAYWASANKERTEVQPDPSCSMLGNGEIVVKKENEED